MEQADAFLPYEWHPFSVTESVEILEKGVSTANSRRSIRHFSQTRIPVEIIENAIKIAATAPSGANKQPWHFVAISDPEIKQRIREAAEGEEEEFYKTKITPEWRDELEKLGTDFVKTHLTDAPWLIVVFRQDYELLADGIRKKNYYMTESVGISVGFLIQALHTAGLSCLTHTPAPMTFLREICQRPINEKPFVIIPVGYPAENCTVPNLTRKSFTEVCTIYSGHQIR